MEWVEKVITQERKGKYLVYLNSGRNLVQINHMIYDKIRYDRYMVWYMIWYDLIW